MRYNTRWITSVYSRKGEDMKDRIKKAIYWFVKNNGMTAAVSVIAIISVLVCFRINHVKNVDVFDFTIFFSILVTMILEVLAVFLSKLFMNLLEDSVKLDTNYEKLAGRYQGDLVTYDNESATSENKAVLYKKRKKNGNLITRLPVVKDSNLYRSQVPYENAQEKFYEMDIEDSQEMYELPEDIKEHFEELFQIHASSNVYNQLNIRVKDWEMVQDKFIMRTSRTTFFNSMVTNRSMDVKWNNGLTTRDVYEYGPFLPKLKEEVLSNHLGFNGFVESKDGYIPFVKRNRIVSIGKSTYGDSIGASLKTKYALNESREFTLEGLQNGILKEIEAELKVSENQLEDFSLNGNLISAYRDMVEGGKPQLLFWAKSKLTYKEIETQFKVKLKEKKKEEKSRKWDAQLRELEDGKIFLWIPKSELKTIVIMSDRIVYGGKSYAMMPSAIASVVMLIEFLEWKKEI